MTTSRCRSLRLVLPAALALPPALARVSVLVLLALGLAAAPRLAAQGADAARPEPLTVAIFVFPGVELLDFAGPGEVFAATPNTRVYTVAESRAAVRSMGFVDITPGFGLDDAPAPDVIVLPGGNVPSPSPALAAWIAAHRAARASNVVMSVCNGALILANTGQLAGLDVTTHHSAFEGLALADPSATVFTNRRYVDNGQVLTTAGISAGIDGALHLVSRLRGEQVAWSVARYMEYDWRPDAIAAEFAQPGETLTLPVSADVARALEHTRAALTRLDQGGRAEVVAPERIRQACEQRLARLAGTAGVSDG